MPPHPTMLCRRCGRHRHRDRFGRTAGGGRPRVCLDCKMQTAGRRLAAGRQPARRCVRCGRSKLRRYFMARRRVCTSCIQKSLRKRANGRKGVARGDGG